MSATDPGEYAVRVFTPSGLWAWEGYADNVSDALARAELARQDNPDGTA